MTFSRRERQIFFLCFCFGSTLYLMHLSSQENSDKDGRGLLGKLFNNTSKYGPTESFATSDDVETAALVGHTTPTAQATTRSAEAQRTTKMTRPSPAETATSTSSLSGHFSNNESGRPAPWNFTLHQIWIGDARTITAELLFSCKNYSKVNGWTYKLWQMEEIQELLNKSYKMTQFEKLDEKVRLRLLGTLAHLHVARLHGGLLVDPYTACPSTLVPNVTNLMNTRKTFVVRHEIHMKRPFLPWQALVAQPNTTILHRTLASPALSGASPDKWTRKVTDFNQQVEDLPSEVFGNFTSRHMAYLSSEKLSSVAINNTVILSEVNCGFIPLAANWLHSARRLNITNYVLVARDRAALAALMGLTNVTGLTEAHVARAQALAEGGSATKDLDFGSREYARLVTGRPALLLGVLELGFDVLYSDMDAVWLADPRADVVRAPGQVVLQATEDACKKKNQRAGVCSCFLHIRATPRGRDIVRRWLTVQQKKGTTALDQVTLNAALQELNITTTSQKTIVVRDAASLRLLSRDRYPAGCAFFNESKAFFEAHPPVVAHNNWVVGMAKKVRRFRDRGLWYVGDDFANWTETRCGPTT